MHRVGRSAFDSMDVQTMSFTRDRGIIIFECNNCGNTLDSETKDFDEALYALKTDGWRFDKSGKEYKHYCNDKCWVEGTA